MLRVRYQDADGHPTDDPAVAVRGEIVDNDAHDQPRQETRFWLKEDRLPRWLPVGEAAFLLWVLVGLVAAWLVTGFALGLI